MNKGLDIVFPRLVHNLLYVNDKKQSEEDIEFIQEELKELEFYRKRDKQFKQDVNNVADKLKALEIIKECFTLNGFDEFIPNDNWWKSEEKQKLLKKVLL